MDGSWYSHVLEPEGRGFESRTTQHPISFLVLQLLCGDSRHRRAQRAGQHIIAKHVADILRLDCVMRLVFSFWFSLSLCEGGSKHLLGSLALDCQRHQAISKVSCPATDRYDALSCVQQEGQCSDEMTNPSSCGSHVVRWVMVSSNGKGQKQGPFLLHQTYH